MSVLRSRAPEQVRRDALTVAERKAAEGCTPCAETYLSVAEQHGASPAEVDRTRRRLFARAGALAGVGLAASLVDVGALAVRHALRRRAAAGAQDGALRWPGGPRPVARRAVSPASRRALASRL